MTASIAISHKEAFNNLKAFEKFESFDKKDIHVFGVLNKKIVFIKRTDSFLQRIWFSFLKFLHIIKVDDVNINKLKDLSSTHAELTEYKDWAEKNGKITKSALSALKIDNNNLNQTKEELTLKLANAERAGGPNRSLLLPKDVSVDDQSKNRIIELETELTAVNLRNTELQSKLNQRQDKAKKPKKHTVNINLENKLETVEDNNSEAQPNLSSKDINTKTNDLTSTRPTHEKKHKKDKLSKKRVTEGATDALNSGNTTPDKTTEGETKKSNNELDSNKAKTSRKDSIINGLNSGLNVLLRQDKQHKNKHTTDDNNNSNVSTATL